MQRIRSATAVLLALILLLVTAFLPWIIASAQERRGAGEVSYAHINAVTLNIDNNTLWDSLALVCRGQLDSYEIDEISARLTSEEVLAIAEDALHPYQDAGLLLRKIPFDNAAVEVTPLLTYLSDSPGENGIFWGVFYYNADYVKTDGNTSNEAVSADNWTISMVIDDNTGKVIGIEYYDPIASFSESNIVEALYAFYQLFFQQLGEPFTSLAMDQMATMEYNPKYYAHTTFIAEDTEAGNIYLYLEVTPHGFSCAPMNG